MTARPHGTGSLFEKLGAWYGRWRALDGRRLSRKLGPVDAIGRREAERRLRALMVSEASAPSPPPEARRHTVDEAAEALIEHKRVQGVSRSYRDAHEAVGFLLSYWRSILEGETPGRDFDKGL